MTLWILCGIVAAIAVAWGIMTIVTLVVGKRFDRRWKNASAAERREMQLSAYRVHAGGK